LKASIGVEQWHVGGIYEAPVANCPTGRESTPSIVESFVCELHGAARWRNLQQKGETCPAISGKEIACRNAYQGDGGPLGRRNGKGLRVAELGRAERCN